MQFRTLIRWTSLLLLLISLQGDLWGDSVNTDDLWLEFEKIEKAELRENTDGVFVALDLPPINFSFHRFEFFFIHHESKIVPNTALHYLSDHTPRGPPHIA